MTTINRTAYPRLTGSISGRELAEAFAPTEDELDWASSRTNDQWDASFEPQIAHKRQRRLSGIDEIVLSLSAKGLTTGEAMRGRLTEPLTS